MNWCLAEKTSYKVIIQRAKSDFSNFIVSEEMPMQEPTIHTVVL